MVQLISEKLQVLVHEKGAEVCSVKNRDGLEFMWQADPSVWPRHAPVLFPIVGKLKEDQYKLGNVSYHLGQHGFARDQEFSIIKNTESECVYELRDNETSRKVYPFGFVFQIRHTLQDNMLRTEYNVTGTGSGNLLFSVGAHPGLNCGLTEGESLSDFYLELDADVYRLSSLVNGLRSGSFTSLDLRGGRLTLSATLFDQDALVFENSQVNHLVLRSRRSGHVIEMHCEGWPYFGIWTKKNCDRFICLEPWHGIADRADASGDLAQKQGIISLSPGESFNCAFSVTFS